MSRPKLIRFADLLGLDALRENLQERVRSGRAAQTMLFIGPPGVGKRSLARAWTAWLSCPNARDNPEACGSCSTCVQLAAGTYPELLWIAVPAGKREISIERARELKKFLALASPEAKPRVAVVERAEALTTAAQNALLKVLEEPPPNSWILLISSTPEGLLPTVRSRCQRIAVPPLPPHLLREALVRHGLSSAEIDPLVPLAEGSVGRALELRESVSVDFARKAANFLATLGQARYAAIAQFVEELSRPESALEPRLQMVLAMLREQATEFSTENLPGARIASARAQVVLRAWRTLREGYPNRTLLLEAMLLEMAQVQP
ncbi:MAG: DNA polymerase III subunit [Candidatus Binatia bacterium]|nr:DNA polymerase III subunit [Candidatus Binatia bacterium]